MKRLNILITGSFTLDLLTEELKKLMPQHNYIQDNYNSYLNTLNEINKYNLDIIILYLDSEDPNSLKEYVGTLLKEIKIKYPNIILIVNFPIDVPDRSTPICIQKKFNLELTADYILDLNKILYLLGYDNAYSSKSWYLAKIKFSPKIYSVLALNYKIILDNIVGNLKKVLILDLDNTLWWGIAGDENIRIDKDGLYSSFWKFQEKILAIKKKGILLAICSKNELKTVVDTFSKNEMPLKASDFIVIKSNWCDKATNIREIAKDLNLGLDSFVYLDDNPTEVAWVMSQIPEIEAYTLPPQFTKYPDFLDTINSLKKLNLTKEDDLKTELYKLEENRKKYEHSFTSYEDFLQSLNLQYILKENDSSNITRLAQMTQKTNQFNLTLNRYTEKDIQEIITSGGKIYSLALKDIFGDYGIVALGIVRENRLDQFLVSCRAFNKKVEDTLIKRILDQNENIEVFFKEGPKNKNIVLPFLDKYFKGSYGTIY